jgi:drug/metabolite transporter (DMT)-like permease
MSETLFGYIRLISSLAVLLPMCIALWKHRRWSQIQRKLVYLLVAIFIVEAIANILWYQKKNNLPVYHFYSIAECILILNLYKDALKKMFSAYFFRILGIIFTVFALVNMFYFQKLTTFNSNVTTTLGFLVIFLCLCYFYALLKEETYSPLEKKPMFWINAGFLMYFSSNLILFFINNSMFTKASEVSYLVWGLHAIVNIILILFFTIAIWIQPKQQ